jgi:hypothetical protein
MADQTLAVDQSDADDTDGPWTLIQRAPSAPMPSDPENAL